MFIEFKIDGVEQTQVIPIEKASSVAKELEKRGKKFQLGKTF